jgi:uncharacterized protein (DUF697 family)
MSMSGFVTKRVGGKALDRAFDELSYRLTDATRSVIDLVVKTRAAAAAADVDVFRLQHADLDARALERAFIRHRGRRAGAGGLVSGLPGIVPAAGTAVEMTAAVADAAHVTYAQVALVLSVAHLRGRDLTAVDARRLDVLVTLGLEADVVSLRNGRFKVEGHEIEAADIAGAGLPEETVAQLNRELGERVVGRIAKRRARMLAGRLIPLGIGVAVAGVEDLRWVQSVGRAAVRYFDAIDSARPASGSARS